MVDDDKGRAAAEKRVRRWEKERRKPAHRAAHRTLIIYVIADTLYERHAHARLEGYDIVRARCQDIVEAHFAAHVGELPLDLIEEEVLTNAIIWELCEAHGLPQNDPCPFA